MASGGSLQSLLVYGGIAVGGKGADLYTSRGRVLVAISRFELPGRFETAAHFPLSPPQVAPSCDDIVKAVLPRVASFALRQS